MLVRSYRTVSPLPPRRVAVCFLWHFPASYLGLPLAITLLSEVRTFLDSAGAHEPTQAHGEPRPPGQLVRENHRTRCAISRPAARCPVCQGPICEPIPASSLRP